MTTLSTNRIDELRSLLDDIRHKLTQAAAIVVSLLDAEGMTKDDIAAQSGMRPGFIDLLERVGRAQLDEKLVFAESPGEIAARRLPLSDQRLLLTQGAEIYAPEGDRRLIPLADLTPLQAQQLVEGRGRFGRLRSLAAQRSWIEEHQHTFKPAQSAPFIIRRHRLIVTEPTEFARGTLQKILRQMEAAH